MFFYVKKFIIKTKDEEGITMCQININELETKINNSTKDEFLLELEGTIN